MGPGEEKKPILEVRGLTLKKGGHLVLEIPSFTVYEGEVVALIGPNGAGKSTLLQCLCFLEKRAKGEILFRGERPGKGASVVETRRKLAMVFQEPLLFDTTVFANVAAGLRFRSMERSDVERVVAESLDQFGITQLRDRSARTLSGGEGQRASLARAFATRPEILFLDEPFSALDPPTRESLLVDLEGILAKRGTTTVFATHDRLEALRLSNRIAVMREGQIVQIGTPEEVMNRPVDEFVAAFVGMETILRGTITGVDRGTITVSVAGLNIEVMGEGKVGDQAILCLRPENVTLHKGLSGVSTSARNVFRGTIVRIDDLSFIQRVTLDCGFHLVAFVTRASVDGLPLRTGESVDASFKTTGVHAMVRRG